MVPEVVDEEGNVLNPRKVRMVRLLGIKYEDITVEQYQSFKREEYRLMYSNPERLGALFTQPIRGPLEPSAGGRYTYISLDS